MNIQEALKPTGKARKSTWNDGAYVYLRNNLIFLKGVGNYDKPYSSSMLLKGGWVPHYEEKEIRPEKYQIWKGPMGGKCLIFEGSDNELWHIFGDGSRALVYKDMIHNKHGWTRFDPPVEDDVDIASFGQRHMNKILDIELRKNKELRSLLDITKSNMERQKQEYEKMIMSRADKPFIMDEVSARAAGKWPLKGNVFAYAESLATSIWEKHYKDDSPDWKPLDTVYGMLSQIDNMVTGLQKPVEDGYAGKIEIDRVEWDTDGDVVYPKAGFSGWKTLIGKPPMKMILVF